MKHDIQGNPDYGDLRLELEPGEVAIVEGGSMSRMSHLLEMRTTLMGGLLGAIARKLLSGQSLLLGRYKGPSGGWLNVSPRLPGCVLHRSLSGSSLRLTAGSFLACSEGIRLKTRFAGFRAIFSGDGAFVLDAEGTGDLFYSAYGAVQEEVVDGSLIVDTGHVVAWERSLDFRIRGMGGLKQTLFSGEGLVMEFHGRGSVWVQTRTAPATAGWLTGFLRG